ncbi:hypothetical protein R76696_03141 [Ralstonia mannitolilytica]|nr:hypothetical protein R76696_03141 [Ralstonia mannitolilytica]
MAGGWASSFSNLKQRTRRSAKAGHEPWLQRQKPHVQKNNAELPNTKELPMLQRKNVTGLWLTLVPLTLLLTSCAHESPSSWQPVAPPAIPPLPAQARVSLVETPSMCSSTCSAGLTALRESLANTPTGSRSPGSPASAPMTR